MINGTAMHPRLTVKPSYNTSASTKALMVQHPYQAWLPCRLIYNNQQLIMNIHELMCLVKKNGMHIGGVRTLQELRHLDRASHKHKSTILKEPNNKLQVEQLQDALLQHWPISSTLTYINFSHKSCRYSFVNKRYILYSQPHQEQLLS